MKIERQAICVFRHEVCQNDWIDPKGICVKVFGPYEGPQAWAYADALNGRHRRYWYDVAYVSAGGEFIAV